MFDQELIHLLFNPQSFTLVANCIRQSSFGAQVYIAWPENLSLIREFLQTLLILSSHVNTDLGIHVSRKTFFYFFVINNHQTNVRIEALTAVDNECCHLLGYSAMKSV
jgi:hypothetical protein